MLKLRPLAHQSRSAWPLPSSLPRPLCALVARRRSQQVRSAALAAAAPGASSSTGSAGFAGLGLGAECLTFLREQGLQAPTEIQAAAVPQLLAGKDTLLASHTGSGKTLAYLLPLAKLLRDEEASTGHGARPRRPRALIMGPTRELTDQILRVAKSLSHHAKFRSACVNGGGTMGLQTAALQKPLDILIGTPQKLQQHAERGNLFWGDVKYVVLDEADTMFDESFGPEVKAVLRPLRSKPDPASVVLVMATLSKPVQRMLAADFPGLASVKTASLHRGVGTAAHTFTPVAGNVDKLDVLAQVVGSEQRRGQRVMVFCNTLGSCRAAEHHLRERGLATVSYHGDVPLDGRSQALEAFAAPAGSAALPPLLICTDLAARGLDVPSGVDLVVNFDFPLNPVDFIHRTGRTARAGAPGRVTSLVTKRDATLASRIERALAKGLPLDELSGDKARLPPDLRPKAETLKRRAEERRAERNSRKGLRGAARHAAQRPGASQRPGSSSQRPGASQRMGVQRPGVAPRRPGASAGGVGRARPGQGGAGSGGGRPAGVGSGGGRSRASSRPPRGQVYRSTKR